MQEVQNRRVRRDGIEVDNPMSPPELPMTIPRPRVRTVVSSFRPMKLVVHAESLTGLATKSVNANNQISKRAQSLSAYLLVCSHGMTGQGAIHCLSQIRFQIRIRRKRQKARIVSRA